ncbi:methylenetetrahydrofolate reductase [Limimonas halophila]|nr:methylenetetrahydrofolate reductase [Limimonas halophila]
MSSARDAANADRPSDRSEQIRQFVRGWSIETTPKGDEKVNDYNDHLHPGTKVAVTFLPGSDYRDTVRVAARLRREGFEPAPHIAARSLKNKGELEDFLARLRGEADVRQVVALAGAVDNPVGEFSDSMQLLETGLFDKQGIEKIGVAGHPEGSPDISDEAIMRALKWKNGFAERTDAHVYIVTQFIFEAQPVIEWDRKIQAEGNTLPIHIGVPGLATIKTLLNYARWAGIGNSIQFLTRRAKNVSKLMSTNAPDELVSDLAKYWAEDPNCGIERMHIYPLGGLRKSAAWANAVVDGDFQFKRDGRGFTVNRDIG